jgi:hypothetical protein
MHSSTQFWSLRYVGNPVHGLIAKDHDIHPVSTDSEHLHTIEHSEPWSGRGAGLLQFYESVRMRTDVYRTLPVNWSLRFHCVFCIDVH